MSEKRIQKKIFEAVQLLTRHQNQIREDDKNAEKQLDNIGTRKKPGPLAACEKSL